MYEIGDSIVYPMHGAGIIEDIEEKEILGEKKSYYIVRIPIGEMKVMIPVDNCDEIGIRDVIDREEADKVIESFDEVDTEVNSNWNKRYRENMEKIKTGDIMEIAQVVATLLFRDNEKGLSTGERKMLSNAKQILISELVIAKDLQADEVEKLILKHIDLD